MKKTPTSFGLQHVLWYVNTGKTFFFLNLDRNKFSPKSWVQPAN